MSQRSTTQRDRDRATIRRGHPACALCGQPIDYSLPHFDPGEFVVDHVVPLHRGGVDRIHNKQPAHRACNAIKAARLVAPIVRRSGTLG